MKKPFGYKDVEAENKQKLVGDLFSKVANNYDLMNDFMSFGLHKLWKKHLVYQIRPKSDQNLLDLAGGTGDIAKLYLSEGGGNAYVLDLTFDMLNIGRLNIFDNNNSMNVNSNTTKNYNIISKYLPNINHTIKHESKKGSFKHESKKGSFEHESKKGSFEHESKKDSFEHESKKDSFEHEFKKDSFEHESKKGSFKHESKKDSFEKLEWICGDCEELPVRSGFFDKVVISFGLRNTTHIEKVIKEVDRVLKVGGKFFILEFAVPTNPLVSFFHNKYLFEVVPRLGEFVAKDKDSYLYLSQSIKRFENPGEIKDWMKKIGFKNISIEELLFGTVVLMQGLKVR